MPSAPQARGCPVPSPLHCCPTGAPRSTPAGQAHPPYSQRSLTFPQDTVHAIQGMGIAARSKRGRCQGLRFPHVLPPPQHCLPPALQHPLPTHFRRRWAGCLTSFCILQGRAGGCHVFMGGCGGGDTCPPAALSWALLRAAAPSQRTSSSLPGPCLGPSHRSGSCPSRAGDPHQNLL